MGICINKQHASTDSVIKVLRSPTSLSPLMHQHPRKGESEEQKNQVHNANSHVPHKSKPHHSPKLTEFTEDQEPVQFFGHQLQIEGAPCTSHQNGFEEKKVHITSENISVDIVQKAGIGYVCKKGLKPDCPNQDDFCVWMDDSSVILGVFDGHGPFGHYVSDFVHTELPKLIHSHELYESNPMEALKSVFPATNANLRKHCEKSEVSFDCMVSGTTASIALIREKKIYIAYVGDSRVVLGKRSSSGFEVSQVTIDHKPTLPAEKTRIEQSGGEVKQLPLDIPFRIFAKGTEDPGLSMSRSIGDTISQNLGVSCEPEVLEIDISAEDEFLLLCSDGVWEFIKNEEAVDLVSKFSKTQVKQAAEKLSQLAWMRWLHNEDAIVDDITVLVAFVPKL